MARNLFNNPSKPVVKKVLSKDLTAMQKECLLQIQEFLKGDDKMFAIIGYAGCGKTTVLNVLARNLEIQGRDYDLTATTNEACRVLQKVTGYPVPKTIYSLLKMKLVEESDTKATISKEPGEGFEIDSDLLIVDECSMITNEVFSEIKHWLGSSRHNKVIFVGDSAQLPPVTDCGPNKESIVFKEVKLRYMLTEPLRFGADNPLLETVTLIRQNLTSPTDTYKHETKLVDGKGVIFYTDKDAFTKKMLETFSKNEYSRNRDYVRAVAYRNLTVDALNHTIRKHLFGEDAARSEYLQDESLRVKSPLFVERETMGRKKKKPGKQLLYTTGDRVRICDTELLLAGSKFEFEAWALTIRSEYDEDENRIYTVYTPSKSGLAGYQAKLQRLANEAKEYIRNNPSDWEAKKTAWKPYFELKEQFAWFSPVYSLTAHSSQGGTVEHVFADGRDLNHLTWCSITKNRLKYVAFTRARKTLHVLV